MLKYVDAKVVFAEIPDEITLAISISGCPCHCKGCHSAYLAEDIGVPLSEAELTLLIKATEGISCVAFMGGDAVPEEVSRCAAFIKHQSLQNKCPHLKVAWYSGRQELSPEIDLWDFDYIKLGPYKEEYGPLDRRTTNQRFYKVVHTSTGKSKLCDITYKFWKHN